MPREQNSRWLTGLNHTTTLASTATTFVAFDTLNYDYAEVVCEEAASPATDTSNQCIAIVLQHSTTTDATNATAIAGATTGTTGTATASQFTMPVGNDTTFGSVTRFFVKLADKERYIALDLTPGNSTARTFSVGCRLTQGDNQVLTEAAMIEGGSADMSTDQVNAVVFVN